MMHRIFLSAFLVAVSVGFVTGCKTVTPPPVPLAPPVTVIPSATSVPATQPLSIMVSVSGSPTPTGAVAVTSVPAFTSPSTTLSNGSASVTVPANTLAVGTYTFLADYTPDAVSSATYTSSTGVSVPVIVTAVITSSGIVVPWALPPGCTSTTPCNFWVYRITGTCPSALSGSAGWLLLTTTPITQATSYTDASVVSGTQYSYDVESGTGSIPTSGPSSCSTFTAP